MSNTSSLNLILPVSDTFILAALHDIRYLFALLGHDLVDCIREDIDIMSRIVGNGLDQLEILFVSNCFLILPKMSDLSRLAGHGINAYLVKIIKLYEYTGLLSIGDVLQD